MATDGMWIMTDDFEFELIEPYKTMLQNAKLIATCAWTQALLEYLAENSIYDPETLKDELLERNRKSTNPLETVDGFILEALGGDL